MVLLGLGLSGCSSPSPEDITKRDELYQSELVKRGFTDPVKLGDSSSFLGSHSDWAAGLGTCRLVFRINDGDLNDWARVSDAATLLTDPQYAKCSKG